jgi:hypothetical protein
MFTAYATFVDAVDDFLTANADDAAAQAAKAEKDLLVAEFQALQASADAKLTALQGA